MADRLDVQPDEIEICEKIDDPNGCPAIILSDALANGAGIVSYLFEDGKLKELIESIVNFKSFDPSKSDAESFMHSLITEDHKENCLTACQKNAYWLITTVVSIMCWIGVWVLVFFD
ncbi:MAG: hypothetical protein L6U16_07930 [Porphyromonadaceae bacterium]|nr:MAG: hypothetical protein L6U16_07930 [Porphyromonadaceae bacterium]